MDVKRWLLFALVLGVPTLASAQAFPTGPLVSHVIVDSCSGCGGSAGPIAIDQTTPGTTNGVVVNNVPHVVCDSGCGSPPATADNSAFTFGTTSVSPIGAVVDDVSTNNVTENSFGAPRMSPTRLLYADLSKTGANATALKVDGSAVTQPVSGSFFQATQPVSGTFWQATQPVSGTFWQATQPVSGTVTTTPPSNASTNVAQIAGTATDVNSGTKSAGTIRVVLATDQPALTNKLLVTPDSVALPANQSVNVAQMGGVATSMNTGVRDTGTQRVTIATNDAVPVTQATATNLNAAVVGTGTAGSPAGNILTVQGVASMTKLLVTPDSVALPANQSVNAAQIAGTNTVTGGVAGLLAVGGNVANAVAATANPVPVGGIFTTTPATLTTGQTATLQFTAAQNAKHDLTTIAGTAPTTVGKLDVKGADGDVFVRQATATNLNAAIVNGQPARTSGTLTSTTCPGTGCVSITTTNYGVVTLTISGTYSLGMSFEMSDDGTNFYATTCSRTDSGAVGGGQQEITSGGMANVSRAWNCSIFGTTSFRVRCTSFTSGTGNIGLTLSATNVSMAPAVALTASSLINTLAPAITKGTQSSAGWTTQDLKDAGRTIVTLTAERVVPILTTDTIISFSKLVGDTVTAAQTTYQVTSGKTLRLQSLHVALTPSSTTLGLIQLRLRTLSSGACIVSTGLRVAEWELGNGYAGVATPGTQVVNFVSQHLEDRWPDGLEFSGASRNICLSMNALGAAAQTVTISLVGYEY